MKKLAYLLITLVLILSFSIAALSESASWSLIFDNDQYSVYIGKQVRIITSAESGNGEAPRYYSLTWTSSDETIARVNYEGTVTGVSEGKATITATVNSEESITKSVEVEVRKPVKSITIEPSSTELLIGSSEDKAKATFTFTIDPEDAYDQSVVWNSNNEAVATVNENGIVTAHTTGSAYITATSTDPSSQARASVRIVVGQAVTDIELDSTEAAIPINTSLSLRAVLYPSNCSNRNLTWSSSNEEVATVNAYGSIKAISIGKAIITCEASDGSETKATCSVTVVSPVKKITLNESKGITIPVYLPYQLTANVEPEDASIKDILWTSSNEAVATVDENGLVTGLTYGSTTITASAVDGSNVKASIPVKIDYYDLVFTNRSPQEYDYMYSSGKYNVTTRIKNGCVSIPDISGYRIVSIVGGNGLTSASILITPLKPGDDIIIIDAGRVHNEIKVYVSEEAFGPPEIQDLGFGKGAIVGTGTEGVFNEHSYKIFETRTTWNQAKSMCESEGGYLATITSSEEQQFIDMLNARDLVLWIGCERNQGVSEWKWVTDEPFEYTNWASGEPNNYNGNESKGGLYPDRWNDFNKDSIWDVNGYICEWETAENYDKNQNSGMISETGLEGVFDNHTYKIFNDSMTWEEAQKYCECEGGHLATITSEKEQLFIELLNSSRKTLWIGSERGESLNDWKWITGEEFNYSHWADGEPNNYNGNETKGAVRPDTWNDFNKDSAHEVDGFICEWDTDKSDDINFNNSHVVVTGAEGVFNEHYYKMYNANMTWDQAKAACEEQGGHLVTITSAEEQQFIEALNNDNQSVWIGCERTEEAETWKWITDEAFSFSNWSDGEPNNYNGNETKGAIRPDKWNDFNEDSSGEVNGFLCEWDTNIYEEEQSSPQ